MFISNVGHHQSLAICDFAKTVREEGVASRPLVRFVKQNFIAQIRNKIIEGLSYELKHASSEDKAIIALIT